MITFWKCISLWTDWHFVCSNRKKKKNYCGYYLNNITVALYILYDIHKSLNERLIFRVFDGSWLFIAKCVQFRLSVVGWICVFCKYNYFSLSKYWPTSGFRSNVELIHFPTNNKDLSKILQIFEITVHLTNNTNEKYNTTVILFK